jgi:hypothetical protein
MAHFSLAELAFSKGYSAPENVVGEQPTSCGFYWENNENVFYNFLVQATDGMEVENFSRGSSIWCRVS